MAINESQKVDWLWKKLGYGVAKTDINSVKAATNESIASPLLIRGDNIWQDASQIPATKPSSSSTIVEIYDDSGNGTATIETTADATSTPNRTWKTNLIDWVSSEFGSTYQVKVYLDNAGAANPQTTGTQLFAAGSGNNDEWFFDYQAGVLNFIGNNLPGNISGKKIYIVGARYIGNKGGSLSSANIGNLTFNVNTIGVSNSGGDIILDPDGTGKLTVLADNVTISGDGAITIPVGTTAERPIPNAQGMIRYNTTDSTFEGFDGANWGSLGGVKDVDQNTYIIAETSPGANNNELDFYTDGSNRMQIGATGNLAFGDNLTEFTIDSTTGNVYTAGNLQIAGNLQVDGTVTIINSTTVTIDDPIFTLGGDTTPVTDDNKDRGIEFKWYDGLAASARVGFFGFDDSSGKFTFIPNATNTNEVFSGTAGDIVFGEATLASAIVSDLTDNRIVIAGTAGALEDDANFTFNGTELAVGVTNFTVQHATGNTDIAGTLDVTGDSTLSVLGAGETTLSSATISDLTAGRVVLAGTAGAIEDSTNLTFDGTDLTASSAVISDLTDNRIVIAGTAGALEDDVNLTFDGTDFNVTASVNITGDLDVDNININANTITSTDLNGNVNITPAGTGEVVASTLTVSDLTDNRLVLSGASGALEDSANLTYDGSTFDILTSVNITGDLDVDNININGNTVISTDTNGNINLTPNGVGEVVIATATVSDLTDNRIVIAGTAGALEDDANFTFDGTTFDVGQGDFTVDVATGNTFVNSTFETQGLATLNTAVVENLTNNRIVIAGATSNLEDDANLTFDGTDLNATASVNITGDLDVDNININGNTIISTDTNGNINLTPSGTGEVVASTLTVSDLTDNRIILAGTAGSLEDDANFTFNGTELAIGLTNFTVQQATGNIYTAGSLETDSEATLASAIIEDLTNNRVLIAGTGGAVEDDANFTFDGTTLTLLANSNTTGAVNITGDLDVDNININANSITSTDLNGNISITPAGSGEVIASTLTVSDLTANRVVLAGIDGAIEDSANLTFGLGILELTGNFDVTGSIDVSVEATLASAIVSDLTNNRITIAGTAGALEDDANFRFNGNDFMIGASGSETFKVTVSNGNVYTAGNLQIAGNLQVDGTTTTVNSATVTIDDPVFTLGGDTAPTIDDNLDRGIEFRYFNTTAKIGFFGFDDSSSKFTFIPDATNTGEVFSGNVGDAVFGNMDLGSATINSIQLGVTASNEIDTTAGNLVLDSTGGTVEIDDDATISGTLGVTGETTLSSAIVSDLTDNRIVITGTAGAIEDDANLTFNGTELAVGVTNFTVQQATGNVYTAGTLHTDSEATLASAIIEDLTDNRIVIAGTAGALEDDANFTFDGTTLTLVANSITTGSVDITGDLDVDNININANTITSTDLNGNINITPAGTGEVVISTAAVSDLTDNRIVIVGTSGALEDDANFTFDGTELAVGVTNFTVQHATGNTDIAGTLTVGTAVSTTTIGSILDEDDMVSDSNTALATQQSIKAYIDSSVSDVDLTFTDGAANGTVNLITQSFTIAGTSNEIETSAANQTITIGLPSDVTIGNDLIITNDLTVNGDIVTLNTASLLIEDPIITIGGTSVLGSDTNLDKGIEFNWHNGATSKVGFFGYDDSANTFTFIPDATNTLEVISGAAGDVVFGEGTFTGITASNIQVGITTDNTINTTSGALTIDSADGTVTVDDNLTVTGEATLASAIIEDLTNNRIIIAGPSSELEDDANFRFDGTTFMLGASGSEVFTVAVATGNTNINGTLNVQDDTDLGGSVTLGASAADNIIINGVFASNLIPDATDTRDIGSSLNSWRDLYLTESINFKGATSENEIIVPTNLADSLSIKDSTGDLIVINTTTGLQKITITPALEISTSFKIGNTVTVTGMLDEDDMVSDSNTALATQQSIKAYVDNQNSTQDLNFAGDSGTGTVLIDSETFTIAGTSNEIETSAANQTITIGLPSDVTVSNDLTVGNDLIVTGDLTVSGTTTYVNTTELNIGDNIITLNADLPGISAPTENSGIEINRGSSTNVSLIWDETVDKWTVGAETIVAGTFEGSIDGGTF